MKMITRFPAFSSINLRDKKLFDKFNSQFPPYADWAFGTLVAWWNIFDDLEVSQLDHNLIIKSSYLSMGEIPQLTLLGNHNIDRTIQTLFTYQKEHGLKAGLSSLPQYTIDAIQTPNQFDISEDLDTSEYIFSVKMHASLEGNQMSRIRQRVNQFNHLMQDHLVEVKSVPLDTPSAKMLLINTLHTWKRSIYKNDNERLEGLVIDRSLAVAEDIGLQSLGLFINKKLEGFVLYKHLPDKHANINHIKVSYNYPNIFQYMFNILAIHLEKEGIEFFNGEQDLGIEGLRIYKSSLRPIHQLKKYNVRPAS